MRIAVVGLGRMGMNMARRLLNGGHEVVVFNRTEDKIVQMEAEGAIGVRSLEELVKTLKKPRVVWLMLPAGDIVDRHIDALSKMVDKGDIIIDGANGYYKDDVRRAQQLGAVGVHYLDAGVSGGIWGLRNGYCIMVGGSMDIFKIIEPVVKTLAPEGGYMYCGESGAGHFVKMIHNGIEYALMESYGEGFELLKASPYGNNIDLEKVAAMWNSGSVIRSWLLELLRDVFSRDPELDSIRGHVEDSGEARWTVKEAVDFGVAADVISSALFKRFNSRQDDVFANRIIAALRNAFGGHALARADGTGQRGRAGAGLSRHAVADEHDPDVNK